MDTSPSSRRALARMGLAILALPAAAAACVLGAASHRPDSSPVRPRAFVGTFDRVLIAGFLADRVADRGRELDLNGETARLIRMALRSKTAVNVIESAPVHLPQSDRRRTNSEDAVFDDVAFWKRLGEEYRQPLILTGSIAFRRAGPQTVERQVGPRTATLSRPRFRLDLRLVFISGRTGDILESLPLEPVAMQTSDVRTSALGLYFQLMDRLAPSVLAIFGHETATHTSR